MAPGGWSYWKTPLFLPVMGWNVSSPPNPYGRVLSSRTLFGTRVFTEVSRLSEVIRGILVP